MAQRLSGQAWLKLNGQLYRSKPDAQMMIGGENKTPQPGDGKAFIGYTSEPVPATVEATFLHANDVDIVELGAMLDISIDFEMDSGTIYRVGDGQFAEPPSIQSGELSVSFFGKAAKKVI